MAGGAEGMAGLAPDSGSGASGRGVPPSNGPRPCGCAADQICVAWQVPSGIPSGMTPDCWIAPAECLSDSYVRGIEALCGCFNPCGAWLGGDGLACYDRRTNPGLLRGPEDLRCILRGP
jgi:hypothetical protein